MIKLKNLPIKRLTESMISSPFGPRINPITRKQEIHGGVDFRINTGTPVLAVADGRVQVSKIQGNRLGYGNYIVIAVSYTHLTLPTKRIV